MKLDKKFGRKNIAKAAEAQRGAIIQRMVASALVQAELMRRRTGWEYNGDRFFTFVAQPEFIAPPAGTATGAPNSPPPSPAPVTSTTPAATPTTPTK